MKVTTTAYADNFTVSRAELDEARRTAYPMAGVAALARMKRELELAEQHEREMFADIERHRRAVEEYPAKLAAWQETRKARVQVIEDAITRGVRYTPEQLGRMVDEIWSTKPVDPNEELRARLGWPKRER